MSDDTARQPVPESVAGPVGRVNLPTPQPEATPSQPASPPSTDWTVRNIIIGVIALVITVGGLLLILQGAFQLTPA